MAGSHAAPELLSWLRVGTLEDIPPLGARVVTIAEQAIAIFRTSDDRVFAVADRCPHRGGPLSQGIVHGHCVSCPLHDWVIDLGTGRATGPDEGATDSFPVRLEDDKVLLGLASNGRTARSTSNETPANGPAANETAAELPAETLAAALR